jgi:allantoin racemase
MAEGLGVTIACLTLAEGPPGIESQAQADLVIPPLLTLAGKPQPTPRPSSSPVSAIPASTPCATAPQNPSSASRNAPSHRADARPALRRHRDPARLHPPPPARLRRHGRDSTGSPATARLGLGVTELADEATTLARMTEVGTPLRDADGADTC